MRSVAQGIKDYRDTLLRVAQVLRPDGVLLLACASYSFFDEHRRPFASTKEGEAGWTASQTLFSAVYDMARCVRFASTSKHSPYLSDHRNSRLGGDVDASGNWEDWLKESPMYTNVGSEDIFVPIGPWIPSEFR